MSKKKRQTSAEDLIDSLLDDSSGKPMASPKAPESSFMTSFTFDLAPELESPSGDVAPEAPGVSLQLSPPPSLPPSSPQHEGTKSRQGIASSTAATVIVSSQGTAPGSMSESPAIPAKGIDQSQSAKSVVADADMNPVDTVDKTLAVSSSRTAEAPSAERKKISPQGPSLDRKTATQIRFGIGRINAARKSQIPLSGGVLTSAEASLKQSESLRIAQGRINELEREIERVRRENEKLASAGETLCRRSDELRARAESAETQARESKKSFEEERNLFRGQLGAKERDLAQYKAKMEEMESRLESNFKKIRVRERELEHRLEIVKVENATLVSSKDEMVMRLKREVDQLKFETEHGRQRSQELYAQYKEKQETIRRVVRALRIALTMLEGDEDARPLGKAE